MTRTDAGRVLERNSSVNLPANFSISASISCGSKECSLDLCADGIWLFLDIICDFAILNIATQSNIKAGVTCYISCWCK